MQAMEAENRTLRSRLACLEEQLRHASAAADPGPPASNPISPPTTPVRLAAGASSGADDTPAGALEHIAPQVITTPDKHSLQMMTCVGHS